MSDDEQSRKPNKKKNKKFGSKWMKKLTNLFGSRSGNSSDSSGSESGPYGSASGSGYSYRGQTEPSVRPKVRSMSLPPPPVENTIPTPDIVNMYRNESTGYPDWHRLRTQNTIPQDIDNRYIELANMSRRNTNELRAPDMDKRGRKLRYLASRNYDQEVIDQEKGTFRYHPQRDPGGYNSWLPRVQASRRQDEINLLDPRFYQPQRSMGNKYSYSVGPVGRQRFGPTQRRAMSEPDLNRMSLSLGSSSLSNSTNSVERAAAPYLAFQNRVSSLPKEEQKAWELYRRQSNVSDNRLARDRLVKFPTGFSIQDQDKSRILKIRRRFQEPGLKNQMDDKYEGMRAQSMRRNSVKRLSRLPPAFPENAKESDTKRDMSWVRRLAHQPIEEEEEPEDQQEEEQ